MEKCIFCGLTIVQTNVKDGFYNCLCGAIMKNGVWEKKGETLKVEGVDEDGKFKKANIYND